MLTNTLIITLPIVVMGMGIMVSMLVGGGDVGDGGGGGCRGGAVDPVVIINNTTLITTQAYLTIVAIGMAIINFVLAAYKGNSLLYPCNCKRHYLLGTMIARVIIKMNVKNGD